MENSLSQAEIDALLKGISTSDIDKNLKQEKEEELSPEEIDAIGEIGNISIGTSATTLFALLNQKVLITTPKVRVTNWEQLSKEHTLPYVAVTVRYTSGLEGANLLILKEDDVKIITDLMMGGKGEVQEGELTELHLSAISEAMNQMIGSAATSLSQMFSKRINISPPTAFIIRFSNQQVYEDFGDEPIVKISFRMIVGNLLDSEMMQLMPLSFAKSLLQSLFANSKSLMMGKQPAEVTKSEETKYEEDRKDNGSHSSIGNINIDMSKGEYGEHIDHRQEKGQNETIKVQPVKFKPFEEENNLPSDNHSIENIDLVMDIPLVVTVELGRTQKLIREILSFNNGTVIELDKLAGDPVDIYVNEKKIAKGEVVVIDDSFGVRITDIVNPSKRI
ncbi:MAG TPA: flagellar motor switch phosphatase FliY [Clostridiaceae bacterium]|nr:flagellar motor switch phosphatase FliY [Clostridiaceae bacterium]